MSDQADGLTPPSPEAMAALLPPLPDTPADAKPTGKTKRPTTRAERAARSAAAKAKRDTKPSTKAPRQSSLETRLAGSLTQLGLMVAATGAGTGKPALQADGMAVITHAPGIATALDQVAKDDPRVRAALERVLTVSTWGALVGAMLPLVVAIAGNHGVIPPEMAAMLNAAPAPEAPTP